MVLWSWSLWSSSDSLKGLHSFVWYGLVLYPYTAERRDVLGNASPKDREISQMRGFWTSSPERFSFVSKSICMPHSETDVHIKYRYKWGMKNWTKEVSSGRTEARSGWPGRPRQLINTPGRPTAQSFLFLFTVFLFRYREDLLEYL